VKPAPTAVALAEAAGRLAGAYVHIPFCARLCPYCDFAVVPDRLDVADRYIAAVAAEVGMEPVWRPLDTVFFGGGTPSQVSVGSLSSIVDALAGRFGLADGVEVTVEANPEDVDLSYAHRLKVAGITRVSLGAQSFDPVVLASLGRRHDRTDIIRAVEAIRAAGIGSVSLDLIFGDPTETDSSWASTLHEAVTVGADHVSTYALTVEPGTELSRLVRAGGSGPDDDVQAARWETADRTLSAAGYVRYEVSNAARPGHESRHNLSTWAQGEYLAFGMGAHGHRSGVRRRNLRRLDAYLEAVELGRRPEAASDSVGGWDAELERLMLGLRRTVGVIKGVGGAALMASADGIRLATAEIVDEVDDRLVVRDPLRTDSVIRAVLALPARS